MYEDTNLPDDNAIETEDTPISGVTVKLFNADVDGNPTGEALSSTTTDDNGFYEFSDLGNGNYVVVQTQPGDYDSVTDIDGVDDNQIAATIDGADSTGNNFVETQLGAINGNVSEDTTGNGQGDTPIAGVTISLLDSNGEPVTDGEGNPITTTTNEDGNYLFENLTPGDYSVVQTQPENYNNLTEDEGGSDDDQPDDNVVNSIGVTVSPNETDTDNDFVETQLGAINGNVSEDTTGDGQGDTPIAGVTISLLDSNGDPVTDSEGNPITTTTNEDGNYLFENLTPGDYSVVQTQPADYNNLAEDEGGSDDDQPDDNVVNSTGVTVSPNETDTGNDFVETQLGAINGNVSEDTTGNGQGDTPIAGVTLSLLDSNGEPVTDSEGNPITTTTNEDGNYLFENLTPDDYSVVQTQPADYNNLAENEGGSDDDQPDDNVVNSIGVTVSPNETDTGNDFVEVAIPGNIKGRVWNDIDLDGIQDEDEFGVDGVEVKLYLQDDPTTPIATTTTSDGGNYEFLVNSDAYFVEFTRPENTVFSPGDKGNDDSLDSDVINKVSGVTENITLLPGETIELDAGISPDSDGDTIPDVTEGLTGDRDNDGIPDYLDVDPAGYFYDQNTGEIISGASIEVIGPGLIDLTSDGSATGFYQWFIDGTPGIYTMDITLPDGYVFSPDRPPLTPAIDATGLTPDPFEMGSSKNEATGKLFSFDFADNPYYLEFELATGDPFIINNNIPLIPNVATIGGRVWDDTDRNGIEGGFESGIENITVTLIGGGTDGNIATTDDNTVETLVTDSNGEYQFIDLTPGIEYQVVFDPNNLPPEYSAGLTSQDTGNNDQFDSDAEQNTGLTPIVTLNPGDAITDIDAGLLTPEVDDPTNLIEGTPSPEVILGTPGDETIAGYKGQDTLTGGDGNDNFFFNETSDGVDIITDFTSGEDQIDLTSILNNELGYTGNNPIADGHVVVADFGAVGTMIQIDFDGANSLLPKDVVFLEGVSNLDANPNNDFDPENDLAF